MQSDMEAKDILAMAVLVVCLAIMAYELLHDNDE